MSSFSAQWLAVREPADRRARSTRVTRAVADALPRDRPINVLDLAAGTGSNARYLREYFRSPQAWLLVDYDPALLDVARQSSGAGMTTRVVDLARMTGLSDLVADRDLVTASALLDLVSEEWLRVVATTCHNQRAAVLFALSYDGRFSCSPPEPEDEAIRRLFNRHQQTVKDFGPALGPDAAERASELFQALGYQVLRDASDWVLGPELQDFQRQLIDGWAAAGREIAASEAGMINSWRARRIEHLLHGRSQLVVGHQDLAAFMA